MNVTILEEHGYTSAMLGLSLNKLKDPAKMASVAVRLAGKDNGHDKFLRMIDIWLDVTAPRFWWHEFDTYKIGRNHLPDDDEGEITTESESTMNNIKDRELEDTDFEYRLPDGAIDTLNETLKQYQENGGIWLAYLKNDLPEGYLQRRILKINYAVARNIIETRSNHRLPQWHIFCAALRKLKHQELLEVAK